MNRLWLPTLLLSSCAVDEVPTGTVPAFPSGFEAMWTEARSCRQSHEHDLHFVRVFASPTAEGPYRTLDTPYPPGSTLVKVEYDDETCARAIGYTVMYREEPGYAPETFDWRWQQLDRERRVTLDSPFPPKCIACHVVHCQPPKGRGFQLTCVDDAAPAPR